MSARKPSKLKFDLNTDRGLLEAGSNGIDGYKDYLTKEESRLRTNNKEFKGFGSEWSPGASGPSEGGPFEGPPDLAQVRIVHSVGMVMDGGNKARADILWPNIVSSILDKEVQERLKKLSAVQSLPASVKIANATVGDNVAYRNMCHVKVFDAKSPPKLMNTQHLYKKSDGRSEPVGYPLHLLTEASTIPSQYFVSLRNSPIDAVASTGGWLRPRGASAAHRHLQALLVH